MEKKSKLDVLSKFNRYRSLVLLVIMIILAALLSPSFLSSNNILNVLRQVAVFGTVAAGMTFVVLTGGIDLSVGSILGLSGAISASVMVSTNSLLLSVLSGIFIGVIAGVVNGYFISKVRIPAFIVTLATMTLIRGIILVYTNGSPISARIDSYRFLGQGSLLGVPMPVIIMLIIFIIGFIILHYTVYGREVYGIGGNKEAARLSGIKVVKTEWMVYIISGLTSSIAGILLTARLGSAQATAGQAIEMDAIAAAIIGGTSLSGGTGFILPTIAGAIILGLIDNILTLMNVNPHATHIVKGLVILIAVVFDKKMNEITKKSSLKGE
ncbi:ribose ABC transporter permease [Facklamia sp. DSM 111018]|uniref:Ribose ABC transporter permease n=1 Tax=Facklamia lactis TaxID=2749967 RepID=A0ABS0LQT6_9LACT|nr:ribose ABC transporter permease [Facklamia lactis]MBG9980555.1 ribose ABC transporter permease [Facklamia lactis]MBG9986364.1 ribose ABC transporter permease [Facklamia lactis]